LSASDALKDSALPRTTPRNAPPGYITMSLANIPAPTNKRHQPSQEEWKELKLKIWQLYIEEDKSLDRVVKLLGEKQDFVLT
jgi:hypothetical protein